MLKKCVIVGTDDSANFYFQDQKFTAPKNYLLELHEVHFNYYLANITVGEHLGIVLHEIEEFTEVQNFSISGVNNIYSDPNVIALFHDEVSAGTTSRDVAIIRKLYGVMSQEVTVSFFRQQALGNSDFVCNCIIFYDLVKMNKSLKLNKTYGKYKTTERKFV